MKKRRFFALFLVLGLLVSLLSVPASAFEEIDVDARAALLVEKETGEILYEKNAHEKNYPASITKLTVALLVFEAIDAGQLSLDQPITAHESAFEGLSIYGSTAGIKVGEVLTVEQLLQCMLIVSANEACNVVAEYVCGSISVFVERMNTRAQELGCTGTHFANPHGLPKDDHYTTAHDLYRITKEALSHELFATICNTVKHTVPATNMSEERTLSNTNGLINPDSPMYRGYYYEYAKGVKTGHTDAAGYCLISTAEKDGVRLLCIVLGGKGTARANGTTDFGSFSDTLTAYRWVFSHYGWRAIVSASDLICEVPVRYGRDGDSVTVRPAQTVSAVLPAADSDGAPQFEQQVTIYSERDGKPLEAPIKAGDEVGELTVSYNGTVYGTVKLVAAVDVAVSKGAYIAGHVAAFFTNPIVLVILLAIVLALVGYVLWLVRRRKQIEAERRRRRRAQMEAEEARRRALAHETLREFDRDPAGSRRRFGRIFALEHVGGCQTDNTGFFRNGKRKTLIPFARQTPPFPPARQKPSLSDFQLLRETFRKSFRQPPKAPVQYGLFSGFAANQRF